MSDHDGILLEQLQHDVRAILEGQASLAHLPGQVDQMDARLQRVESDVKVIKAVVTDQSSQLNDHEGRITKLEGATP